MAEQKSNTTHEEHTIASVAYIPAKDLPKELIKAKEISAFDFAEFKVLNSIPSTEVSKVSSPAKRVKEILASHNIKIVLE
jgi:hypothetical protein